MRKLKDDEDVKAVVLRVNSPGGSAFASEQIWHAVKELKTEKPVIVSMGDYAASGGYYISCVADTIVAEPTTLTGSIGIFGMVPNVKELSEKIGLTYDVVKTNKFSDFGNIMRPFNEGEKALLQMTITEGYNTFIGRCAEGRHMTKEAIEKIAEGSVNKFLKEVTLLSQPFVKDDSKSVGELLKSNGATVSAFALFVVGEGLEKRNDDFAAEVAAQAAAARA